MFILIAFMFLQLNASGENLRACLAGQKEEPSISSKSQSQTIHATARSKVDFGHDQTKHSIRFSMLLKGIGGLKS